jgi:hypothetical protein
VERSQRRGIGIGMQIYGTQSIKTNIFNNLVFSFLPKKKFWQGNGQNITKTIFLTPNA